MLDTRVEFPKVQHQPYHPILIRNPKCSNAVGLLGNLLDNTQLHQLEEFLKNYLVLRWSSDYMTWLLLQTKREFEREGFNKMMVTMFQTGLEEGRELLSKSKQP